MAVLGRNAKITAGCSQRGSLGAMLTEVFGCRRITPRKDTDVFAFADGSSLGVCFVANDEALSPEQLRRGAWLELSVEEPEATLAALARIGLTPFEYSDKQHHYFQAPGGQVFRLAPQTEEDSR